MNKYLILFALFSRLEWYFIFCTKYPCIPSSHRRSLSYFCYPIHHLALSGSGWEEYLERQLFANYSSNSRPVVDGYDTVKVGMTFMLNEIEELVSSIALWLNLQIVI